MATGVLKSALLWLAVPFLWTAACWGIVLVAEKLTWFAIKVIERYQCVKEKQ